jgi:hypothetical protein
VKISIIAVALVVGVAAQATPAVAAGNVSQSRIVVGSMEPTRESPQAARHEAAAVLADAKRDCAKDHDRSARQACLARAHDDYHQLMEQAGRTG